MKIEILAPKTAHPVRKPAGVDRTGLRRLALRVIKKETGSNRSLNIIFVNNPSIQRLNRTFLKKNRPTNVLAFPGDGKFLGEIYISLDYAKKEAKDTGIEFKTEVERLVIHGLLHLVGYTHKEMKRQEQYYLEYPRSAKPIIKN